MLPFCGYGAQNFRVLCCVSPAMLLQKAGFGSWGLRGFHSGVFRLVPRWLMAAVSCGRAGVKPGFTMAGLSPCRKQLQHQGVPPLPFQAKQDLIGFTFSNTKHKLNLSQKSILKQDCSSEYSRVLLNAGLLQCPCYGEGRCWGEELKNVKQTVFKKQLLRWSIQICCLVLDLFIAIGFTCDIVCRVTLHPSW